MSTPTQVTELLLSRIRDKTYLVGEALPTLDELNREHFGTDAGPRPGRAAYLPLIEAGMVEARRGGGAGHYLISDRPQTGSTVLTEVGTEIEQIKNQLSRLAERLWYVVTFEHIRSGEEFGQSLHPTRLAAEDFAVDMLVRLGANIDSSRSAARLAAWTAADASAMYGVRIWGQNYHGERIEWAGRTEPVRTLTTDWQDRA